jgi:hypothetical protein
VIRRSTLIVPALALVASTAAAQPAAPPTTPSSPPASAPAPAPAPPPPAPPPPAPPPPAAPAEPTADELARARADFAEGKALYDAGRAADAVEKFKESYRLSRNPLLLYNVAFTFDQLAQKDLALLYYRKFLTDAPDTAQTAEQRALATGRVQLLGAELAIALGPALPPTAAAPATAAAPSAADVLHEVVDEAPPGSPLDITASLPERAGWRPTLYYRGGNAAEFTAVPMRLRYRERVARIPAAVMTGTSVQYYLEVKDDKDAVVARFGRPSSPNLVHLDAAARPRFYPDGAGDPGALTLEAGADDDAPPGMPGGAPLVPAQSSAEPRDGTSGIRTVTWIGTGATGALLALSVTFHLIAADKASSLEAAAASSQDGSCQSPPCRDYDGNLKDVADYGKRMETLSHVSLGLGVAAAAATGYLWYRDLTGRSRGRDVIALPVAGDGFVGGAASVRF